MSKDDPKGFCSRGLPHSNVTAADVDVWNKCLEPAPAVDKDFVEMKLSKDIAFTHGEIFSVHSQFA